MRPKFQRPADFRADVTARVHEYLAAAGLPLRDAPQMYAKSAVIALWFSASYAVLVFVSDTLALAALAGVSLGMSAAAIGFNLQHDAAHGAFSRSTLLNRCVAFSLDVVGGSSYLWRWKHNVLHHTYPNVKGADDDIEVGPLGRLTPEHTWHWFHRWQHLYMWVLYGFIPLKWQLLDDFREVLRGRIGPHRIPRPRGTELTIFLVGKVVFLLLAFGIPLLRHPWPSVLLGYGLVGLVMGTILGSTFQMAHCVDAVEFPLPESPQNRLRTDWAVHQVITTQDFAQHNRLLTWYIGGLNFQIEHHLFPAICHLHYPAIAPVVEAACKEYGLPYYKKTTVGGALESHYRWLRSLGERPPTRTGDA